MENSYLRDTKYTGISANETFLLSVIEKEDLPVFGVREAIALSGWSPSRVHNTLVSLTRKGLITRIKRNTYAVTEQLGENVLRIATEVVKPSYVSFWTALSYYGFTEQQVRSVQLVATKQVAVFRIGRFAPVEIVKFKPYRFYGYERKGGLVIAEPEKGLVDSLFRLDLCGGMDEFAKCLRNARPDLDGRKLVDYAIRFGNRSCVSRLGHIIERSDLKINVDRLLAERSRSFVPLNPKSARTGKYDRKWRVIINWEARQEVVQ